MSPAATLDARIGYRRPCSITWLAKRVHIKVVQELLGHSEMSITLGTYSHLLPTMQEEAMGKWNDVFGNTDAEGIDLG